MIQIDPTTTPSPATTLPATTSLNATTHSTTSPTTELPTNESNTAVMTSSTDRVGTLHPASTSQDGVSYISSLRPDGRACILKKFFLSENRFYNSANHTQ